MIATGSLIVVMLFGAAVFVLSLWGMLAPRKLIAMVQGVMRQRSGIYVAVFSRFLLGAALIICAAVARFPMTFQVLGWIALVAAIGLAMIGREAMLSIVGWFDRLSPAFIRLWLIVGVAFGGFLVYGAAWFV